MSEIENEYKSSERSIETNKDFSNEINNKIEYKYNKNLISKSLNLNQKDYNKNKIETKTPENSSYLTLRINKKNFINKTAEKDLNSSQSNNSNLLSSKKRKRFLLPLLDALSNRNSRNSRKSRNSRNNNINILDESEEETIKKINENCLICNEKLTVGELNNNFVECLHGFCDQCYYAYFKEKINNNEIEKIKCPQKDCYLIIFNNFIEQKIINDIPLLEKYHKLKERRQLMLNPNIQLCPFPDCESYAEKGNNKYVSCKENNHQFCFNCLKKWHGNKKCIIDIDKSFENWRDSSKVKRCPKCKYFIEKNEGCNHITCIYCKYQFCWLCMQKYDSYHYRLSSNCYGLQSSNCITNRFCVFLYNILLLFLKNIIFAIIAPFFIFYVILDSLYVCYKVKNIECSKLFSYFAVFLLCFSLYGLLILFSGFISFLMFIIWPLHREIHFSAL